MESKNIITQKKKNWYFHLLADNGTVIATSPYFYTKAAVENGIASVRKNAETHIVEYPETFKNNKYENSKRNPFNKPKFQDS